MKPCAKPLKALMIATSLLLVSACSESQHFIVKPGKSYSYTHLENFTPYAPMMMENKIKKDSRLLATISIADDKRPDEETLSFSVMKINRSYMLEAPLSQNIYFGKKGDKKIMPMLDIGYHHDHKAFAGLVVRVEF